MKYPRTPHLSYSPGKQSDDIKLSNDNHFHNSIVVVTEKLDGENSSLHFDKIHARSLDSNNHPSRNYLKNFYSSIQHKIPEDLQIIVENVYAKHSIFYDKLTSFQYFIGAIDKKSNIFLSYEECLLWAEDLNIPFTPVYFVGKYEEFDYKKHIPKTSKFGDEIEGFVIRNINDFHINDFDKNVAKYVRKGHVQTDEHWTKNWIPNRLK